MTERNVDLKSFISAIDQIAEEKGIIREKIIETIEMAIAAAYKKDYGKKGQIIKAKLDSETGKVKLWRVRIVVDDSMLKPESEEEAEEEREEPEKKTYTEEDEQEEKLIRFNPEKHIMVEEAKEINSKLKPEDELEEELASEEEYGRIAAQTAKQVIIQRIREAEREAVFDEFFCGKIKK